MRQITAAPDLIFALVVFLMLWPAQLLIAMKTLSYEEIESLLGYRATTLHPLEILGYDYTTEGTRKFRTERCDFLPQIVSYVQRVLVKEGIFPKVANPKNSQIRCFIQTEGSSYRVNSLEENGLNRYGWITSEPFSEHDAILEYIRKVTNPDYVHVANTSDQ